MAAKESSKVAKPDATSTSTEIQTLTIMKSIFYLISVFHPKYHVVTTNRNLTKDGALRKLLEIKSGLSIHEKINLRAPYLGRFPITDLIEISVLTDNLYSNKTSIARSRFRNARRNSRKTKGLWRYMKGYSCIDFSFGLYTFDTSTNLSNREKQHLKERLNLAATSRATLPPWSLSDCWKKAA